MDAVACERLGVLPREAGGDALGPVGVGEQRARAALVGEQEGVVLAW